MAKDYAKFVPSKSRASRKKKGRPGMLFPIFLVLFACIALAGFVYAKKTPNIVEMITKNATTFFHHKTVTHVLANKPTKKAVVVVHDTVPPPVHFDFYNELPSMQMTSHHD